MGELGMASVWRVISFVTDVLLPALAIAGSIGAVAFTLIAHWHEDPRSAAQQCRWDSADASICQVALRPAAADQLSANR